MKKHLLALGLLLAGVSPAQALDVGDISSFMNSGSSTRRACYPDGQTG